jgi:L-amino acid N-acyltransferase YncA
MPAVRGHDAAHGLVLHVSAVRQQHGVRVGATGAMPPLIRAAELGDAPAIARIYSEGIEDRVATFHSEPVTAEAVAEMLDKAGDRFPFLVAEREGAVVAFAGVAPYSDFPPYAGVGEYMIYVARDLREQGVGRPLLAELCDESRRRGFHKLVGKLFSTNEPSIELAYRCGFRDVGTHVRHGRLDGEWKDVLVVERSLGDT